MSDLQVFQIDEGHREQWNGFAAQSPHFTLMQSYEWGEFKERLGWKAIRLATKQRGKITAVAQLFIKPAPLGLFSVGYVPRGPLVDWEDRTTTTALLDALHSEARRHRAVFMKIEAPLLNNPVAHRRLQQYGLLAFLSALANITVSNGTLWPPMITSSSS